MKANNFGGSTAGFKTYQTEDMLILNGTVDFNPSNAEYQAVNVLEIYVPTIKLKRSIETVIFLKVDKGASSTSEWQHNQYCTIVKSWIKDERTICVEKFTGYDSFENLQLVFCSLYLPNNKRTPMQLFEKIDLRGTSEQYGAWVPTGEAIVQDNWVYLHIDMGIVSYEYEHDTWEITFDNIPDDLECDIPIPGGNNPSNGAGIGYTQGHLKNKVLTIEKRPFGYGSTGYDPFVLGFFIR